MQIVKKEGIKLTLLCGAFVAVFPFVFNLILNFGEWVQLIAYTFSGFFLGFLIAPELDQKGFPKPILFQTICGVLAGCAVAIILESSDQRLLSVMVFGLLGFTANIWVKYAPISQYGHNKLFNVTPGGARYQSVMGPKQFMNVLAQERMSWSLIQDNENYYLSVLCGTVGIYEVLVTLDKNEICSFEKEGNQFVSSFAQAIRNEPSKFNNRQCIKAQKAVAQWRASRASKP